ncbi:MAG: hypothetical protein ABSC25_10120 [Roseiarcus sp.]
MARGLVIVLRQPVAALRIELPEIAERRGVTLVGGELEKACGLVIVLPQAAATQLEEDPEVVLRFH